MSYIGNLPTNVAFVTDTFSGNGSTVAFTTSVAPASTSSILVAVTGVLQDPSTYSVSGTTLTFSAAPPSGTGNISVRYLGIPASGVTTTAYRTVTEFTATAGQTSFSVPSYTVGYIDVFRNGSRLGTADFTATSGTTVILTNPATAGDLVVTESFYVSSVLNAIPATAGAVNSTYITDAAVTQAKLAAGVAGNGPAFSAYASADQTGLTLGTSTKITLDTEIFDTASCFSSSKFTPNIAGYYQVNAAVRGNATGLQAVVAIIFKNGSAYSSAQQCATSTPYAFQVPVADVIYMNGSTDYLELYGEVYGSSAGKFNYAGSSAYTSRFSASLVRAA